MAKYYPHKQTIVIAFICILAVGGTAAYAYWQPAPETTPRVIVEDVQSSDGAPISTSTDWKKDFFAVTANSNTITTKNSAAPVASDTPLTLTDKIGRDFFARYIQLKQNNLDSNQQLVQGVIDQTIDTAQSSASQGQVYSEKNILVLSTSNTSTIRAYGNAVGDIFGKYAPIKSPADIAYNAFDQNDMSQLTQIDTIVSNLKKMTQLLISTPVPRDMASNHLSLINGISSLAAISQGIRNLEGDPMQSLISLKSYEQTRSDIMSALLNIQSYLRTNNATYASTEPGNLFFTLTFH
ncbi:MAG TPA: hypothetical protein VL335_00285 [Candidatus Paceibacterota bacterium]|jgi:hypothetical protein|nr:hypothetical protein [Candidatus Paceibacterota bacterium]